MDRQECEEQLWATLHLSSTYAEHSGKILNLRVPATELNNGKIQLFKDHSVSRTCSATNYTINSSTKFSKPIWNNTMTITFQIS